MKYTIEIYRNGVTTAPGPEIYYLSDWEKEYNLYTYVFVVRSEELTMLVDTGCGDISLVNRMLEEEFGGRITFDMPVTETFDRILEDAEVDPKKVDYVFISHLHHDHVSNVDLFQNAKIVLARRGIDAYMNENRPYYYNEVLFPSGPIGSILARPYEQVIYVEGSQEILPGIRCHHVGGHTPGCMAVEIETEQGSAVCTSDVAFMRENVTENRPVGLFYNLWECYDAYELIQDKADLLLTSHDPGILDASFPTGRVG